MNNNLLYIDKPLALLTDLYQLTMAYGYWKDGKHEQDAIFNLFFRRNPFGGNYVITSGLEFVIKFIENFKFTEDDIEYLRELDLFEKDFLTYLSELKLKVDVYAMGEGTFVFPNEPILKVKGPLLQCQIIETALLNIINFNSLITTKASRICHAAGTIPVLEFGLRRAQGIDGALTASRAAYIGGCSATSNVLAGKLFGIPVKGTMAHSWVMSFGSELEAFKSFVKTMPDNSILLVDTYDIKQGIENAIEVGKILRKDGNNLVGIRLDSGNLAKDSMIARDMLDDAGFNTTTIVASNDLDEDKISDIELEGHCIDTYGVGTKLITAADDPALGGVYKLSAVMEDYIWINKIKYSENKVTLPGDLQVTRVLSNDDGCITDFIHFERDIKSGQKLLRQVIHHGGRIYDEELLIDIRIRVEKGMELFEDLIDFDHGHSVIIDEEVEKETDRLISIISNGESE